MEYPNAIRPPEYTPDIDAKNENETDIAVGSVETVTPPETVGGEKDASCETLPHRVGNKCTARNHSLA